MTHAHATHPPIVSGQHASLASPSRVRQGGKFFAAVLLVTWVGIAVWALTPAWSYYLLPLSERPYSDLHALFAPSGTMGLRFGIVGAAMMAVGVAMYGARKRIPWLDKTGKLTYWLQFHIFLCTLGPFLILLHTSFKFGGIVTIAFWSMTAVVLSGFFGRYVFVRIPKTINGRFRSLESVRQQKALLVNAIATDANMDPAKVEAVTGLAQYGPPRGFIHALILAIRLDLNRREQSRKIHHLLRHRRIPDHVRKWAIDLLQDQLQLEQQIVLLRPFQQLFRYWHLLHLPLAIAMFVIALLHIAVATALGYGWPF